MNRKADLEPPLGFPGGPCHVIQRIREEVQNTRLQDELVEDVEHGQSMSNADASKVYDIEIERGPTGTRFKQLSISAHAQYRMDQRGVTVTELRLALTSFQQKWAVLKSQSNSQAKAWEMNMAYGEPILWVDPKIHLAVAFAVNGPVAKIITTYWDGQPDPRPGVCHIVAYQGPPDSGFKTLVSPKSDRNLPTDQDREKERVLPPGAATPGSPSSEGGGGDRELPGATENKPDNDIPDRPRTMPERGEDRGVQYKEDYGYVTRRTMEGRARARLHLAQKTIAFRQAQQDRELHPVEHRPLRASASVVASLFLLADETDAPSPLVVASAFLQEAARYTPPSRIPPAKRQKRQQGPDRMDSRRDYIHERPRKNRQMKRRHKTLQRTQQYRKYKKWYNDNYRARGEKRFRRRADTTLPEVRFLFGPESAEGQVRSMSETGMITFEIDGYETVIVMPLMPFVESVTFLSDADIENFFDWVEEVRGVVAYKETDGDVEDIILELEAIGARAIGARIKRTAEGVTFTMDREAPNDEINSPGPNVGYAPSSPTHYNSKPDEKETLPKGETGPDKHEDDVPAGSSRVVPPGDGKMWDGDETYVKAASTRVAHRWFEAATIDAIKSKADALSRSRAQQVGPARLVRADPKNGLWTFSVTGSKGNKVYTVKVKGVRKGRALDVQKLDVRVSCSCPAFRWQGPEHWAKVESYQQGHAQGTATFPHVRDPDHKHPVCKHVLAVFQHMPPMFLDRAVPR